MKMSTVECINNKERHIMCDIENKLSYNIIEIIMLKLLN